MLVCLNDRISKNLSCVSSIYNWTLGKRSVQILPSLKTDAVLILVLCMWNYVLKFDEAGLTTCWHIREIQVISHKFYLVLLIKGTRYMVVADRLKEA